MTISIARRAILTTGTTAITTGTIIPGTLPIITGPLSIAGTPRIMAATMIPGEIHGTILTIALDGLPRSAIIGVTHGTTDGV